MSKAMKIRALLALGKDTRTIAREVGCVPEYVRVVKQRIDDPECGLAWLSSDKGRQWHRDYTRNYQRERRKSDPEWRQRRIESNRRYREKLSRTGS